MFPMPALFAQVAFQDISSQDRYIGSQLRLLTNHIFATLRLGGTRTDSDWNRLMEQLKKAWEDVVGTDVGLNSLVIETDVAAAMENGIVISHAGGDASWLSDNMELFKRKAKAGNKDFQALLVEIQARGLLGRNSHALEGIRQNPSYYRKGL